MREFTVEQWGRVYRPNGPTFGCTGRIDGLSFSDVQDQITNASRRGGWIEVLDSDGRHVSLGMFA